MAPWFFTPYFEEVFPRKSTVSKCAHCVVFLNLLALIFVLLHSLQEVGLKQKRAVSLMRCRKAPMECTSHN